MAEVKLSKCLVDLRFPPVLAASGPFVNDMTAFSNEVLGTNGERSKNTVKHFDMFVDLRLTSGVRPFIWFHDVLPVQGMEAQRYVVGPSQLFIMSITNFNPPEVVTSCNKVTLMTVQPLACLMCSVCPNRDSGPQQNSISVRLR